jgi:geranylgeranyl pyrophosphate synthase
MGVGSSTRADFLDYWRHTRARLDVELVGAIPRFFDTLPAQHVSTITQVLADGKRLRGCLTCLMSDALGGRFEDALPRALAIECIQAASLIHDDVVDGDMLRRERDATWVGVGQRRAVLLGDVIFATALHRMMALSRADGLVAAETISTMASGAYQEPLANSGPAWAAFARVPDLYPRLIHLKTGVLFGAAMRLGSLAADAAPGVAAQAFEFGACVGEAYQVADDLCDLFEVDLATPAAVTAQLPLLAPLLAHFCAEAVPDLAGLFAGGAADICAEWAAMRPLLRQRMRANLDQRLRHAEALARGFVDNGHAALLQAAPAQITRLMLEG